MNQFNNNNFEGGPNMPFDNNQQNPQYQEFILRENEKKKDKKILKTIGSFTAMGVISHIFLASLLIIAVQLIVRSFPEYRQLFKDDMFNYGVSIIESVLFIALPFIISYFIMRRKKIIGILPLGTPYNKKASIYIQMVTLPLVLFLAISINIVSIIFQSATGIEFSGGVADFEIRGITDFLMAAVTMAVVPAITEEIVVRGVILQPLRRYGDKFAILISAVVFSLMHGNMVQIPYTFVTGLILGYVAVATGSIWPCISIHFFNNMFSVVSMTLSCNTSPAKANLLVGFILFVLLLIGVAGAVLLHKINYRVKLAGGVKTLKTSEKLTAFLVSFPMAVAGILILVSVSTTIN